MTMAIANAVNNLYTAVNTIIGGNFDTNPWQRGTTFTAVPQTKTYTADMWSHNADNNSVVNILKTADAPTVAQCGMLVNNCFHLDVTTADASIGAAQYGDIVQYIEGYNAAQILQKPFTLSFWVKATKTGIYCVSFQNDTTSPPNRSYVSEYTINTTDTWEYKTITASASPSSGTWNYTNGRGLIVDFCIAAGSDYQTTAGSWQTGNFLCTANQVNGLDSTANNFKLALVQLQAGSIATPFVQENQQQVLAKCQRYYRKTFSQGVTPAQNIGSNVGAICYNAALSGINTFSVNWFFNSSMRTVPTTIFYNPSAANAKWRNSSQSADSGVAGDNVVGENSVNISNLQIVSDVATETMVIHATADASL